MDCQDEIVSQAGAAVVAATNGYPLREKAVRELNRLRHYEYEAGSSRSDCCCVVKGLL